VLPAGDYARSGYSLPENHPPDIFEDNIFPGIWTKVFERPSNRYLEGGFLYSLCPGQGVGAFPEIVMKIFITLTESTGYSQFDLLPDSVNKAV